jgi:hypothetical protein
MRRTAATTDATLAIRTLLDEIVTRYGGASIPRERRHPVRPARPGGGWVVDESWTIRGRLFA